MGYIYECSPYRLCNFVQMRQAVEVSMSDGPVKCTPKNIWQMRQNKVSLIVNDLAWRVNREDDIYRALLNRGVFKWMAIRRKMIKLKEHFKDVIKHCEAEAVQIKDQDQILNEDHHRLMWLKGYKQAMVDVRKELRNLCHEERWQVQDNDRKAAKWLQTYEDFLKDKIIHEESAIG